VEDLPGDRDSAARLAFRRSRHLLRFQMQFLRKAPLEYVSETVRTRLAAGDERRLLAHARGGDDVCWARTDEAEPLVTIRIATYNRGPLVAERAIASAVRQTYQRLEILVIGDHCDEATERAVLGVNDPRVRFVNLAERGVYPTEPRLRWMVAGSAPFNAGLTLAQGSWIVPCDDDDEITDDHVEVLLAEARRRRLEFVWSKATMEVESGQWSEVGRAPLALNHITHGSILYAGGLRFFRHNENSWKLAEPGDWNLWRRMQSAGVRMGFLDQVTYKHYLEKPWRG
jgi:glycosyltransferase involved in cell wall biosynthesis